jgi:hypothetical protein
MRTAEEIRSRSATQLEAMLLRPGMFEEGRSYERAVRAQLADLAFIDGRSRWCTTAPPGGSTRIR